MSETGAEITVAKEDGGAVDSKPSSWPARLKTSLAALVKPIAVVFSGLAKAAGYSLAAVWFFIFLLILYYGGAIDALLPGTGAAIRIDSPQIYTRERLVNDRFRQQAWLEQQLEDIDDQTQLVNSVQRRIFSLVAKGTDAQAVEDELENAEKLGVKREDIQADAADAFEKRREWRETVRNALIANELDDRHDLGSNTLYQLSFGAAILAGQRTRKAAAIEMKIEPAEPLAPLSQPVENGPCDGLRGFECAFLMESGYLVTDRTASEAAGYLESYRNWTRLFERWLAVENSHYNRETLEIGELLRSSSARRFVSQKIGPFVAALARKNELAKETFDTYIYKTKYLDGTPGFQEETGTARAECSFGRLNRPSSPQGESLEDAFRNVLQKCAEYLNHGFSLGRYDIEEIIEYLVSKDLISAEIDVKALISESRGQSLASRHVFFLDLFLKDILNSFNNQCVWYGTIVKVESGGALAANPPGSTRTLKYRLVGDIEDRLLDCVYNALVRDFGSHPFSRIARNENLENSGVTSIRRSVARGSASDYSINYTLSEILSTDPSRTGRFRERAASVGVVVDITEKEGYARFTIEQPGISVRERLEEICKIHGAEVVPHKTDVRKGDISGQPPQPVVSEFGWQFLSHLICAAARIKEDRLRLIRRNQPDWKYPAKEVDERFRIPVGLFRFINVLGAGQSTFSYAARPSGAFELRREDKEDKIGFTNMVFGRNPGPSGSGQVRQSSSSIGKTYNIISYAAQEDREAKPGTGTSAVLGWYVLPQETPGLLNPFSRLDSSKLNLTALLSVPAWWSKIKVSYSTRLIEPGAVSGNNDAGHHLPSRYPDVMVLELPVRMEAIRDHFPDAFATRPSVEKLKIPPIRLHACQKAGIVLQGQRLWRSAAVTIGGQKSQRIEVLPNMSGIIAHFDRIEPSVNLDAISAANQPLKQSITVWTSQGERTILDTVEVVFPESIAKRIAEGRQMCPEVAGDGAAAE